MLVQKFDKFLQSVDLKSYRDKYRPIKIVEMDMPKEIQATAVTEKGKNPIITMTGIDNQLLGQVAAKIRSLRKPEPYKGKGMRYDGEIIKRKQGKKTA